MPEFCGGARSRPRVWVPASVWTKEKTAWLTVAMVKSSAKSTLEDRGNFDSEFKVQSMMGKPRQWELEAAGHIMSAVKREQ